jgi:hypothetical protein
LQSLPFHQKAAMIHPLALQNVADQFLSVYQHLLSIQSFFLQSISGSLIAGIPSLSFLHSLFLSPQKLRGAQIPFV